MHIIYIYIYIYTIECQTRPDEAQATPEHDQSTPRAHRAGRGVKRATGRGSRPKPRNKDPAVSHVVVEEADPGRTVGFICLIGLPRLVNRPRIHKRRNSESNFEEKRRCLRVQIQDPRRKLFTQNT